MKNAFNLSLLLLALCLSARADAQAGVTPPVKAAGEPTHAAATWTDPATGLTWAGSDNGSDVNWNQARDYCSKSRLAGYRDWRLPTLEELQGIDSADASARAFYGFGLHYSHVKGDIYLTGWIWSSSPGGDTRNGPWHFDFVHQTSADGWPVGFSFEMRALCVREGK